jgi:hypothetical protein
MSLSGFVFIFVQHGTQLIDELINLCRLAWFNPRGFALIA